MELIGSFSYFLGNLALYYVFIIFLINNLKSKLKKWQSFSIFAFVFFVLHLFVLIDVERYRLIFTFVPIFALFVLTGLLFANPIKEKLMLIAVGYSFLLFTSFSIDALIVLLVVDYNTPSVAVYAYVTMNFVYASLLAFFTYLRVKRVGKTAFRRNLLLFLVFPISQFLLLFTMSMIIAYTGIFTGEAMPIFIRSLFMLKVLVF